MKFLLNRIIGKRRFIWDKNKVIKGVVGFIRRPFSFLGVEPAADFI